MKDHKSESVRVIIALGSNIGDRGTYISKAQEKISKRVGKIIKASKLIETEAYGYTQQDDFLNMVIEVETKLSPMNLLKELMCIEKELGRVRTIHWGPRTLDLDIIYYGQEVIDEEDLKIPHPELYNRDFVLGPLEEIEPDLIDPVKNKSVRVLLEELKK